MQAVVYHKPYHITLETVPDPKIIDPGDVILRVSSTSICGSDLHILHGLVPELIDGTIIGHEFMGTVEEAGSGVKKWRKGDRILVPFPVACGHCEMCNRGLWSHCSDSNPHGTAGGIFGYGGYYGGISGGQAEYVRVPFADVSPIAIPDEFQDEEVLLISDVLSTAYWIVDVCAIKPGDAVAVFGCGPVGLMVQRCSLFKGAQRVIAVDHIPYRLAFAGQVNPGVETINFKEHDDPGEVIKEMTGGRGVDVAIDAVGFEAEPTHLAVSAMAGLRRLGMPDPPGFRPEDQPAVCSVSAINWAVKSLRQGGTLGLVGVYGAKANGFPIGDIFARGLTVKCGQALVQNYTEELFRYIKEGRLRADDIFTHQMPLSDAMKAYDMFANRDQGCVKVILKPH